jgi:steroid 5-alpha reductase family enzyme
MTKRLQFQGRQSASMGPKLAMTGWYLSCAAAAIWLTWSRAAGAERPGDPFRLVLLLACVLIYVIRAAYTLFSFVKRTVPWWEAVWGGGIIGCVLFLYLLDGLRCGQPIGAVDGLGLAVYAAGSWIGTRSEQLRHAWKRCPGNRGRLYTGGYFRHSRHINYFADLLVFLGCAVLTRQPWTGIVPLAMAVNFVMVIIPAHDAYLAGRYGADFERYASRTSRLIPYVY